MKKYTKVISFLLLTILTIGVYSITKSQATEKTLPQFTTTAGDNSFLDNVQLSGDFYSSTPNYTRVPSVSLKYEDGNFERIDRKSFFERLNYTSSKTFNDLKEKYPSFLRGKHPYGTFSDTEDKLIYTGQSSEVDWHLPDEDNAIVVSIFDKEMETTKDITVEMPNEFDSRLSYSIQSYINYPTIHYLVRTPLGENEENFTIYSLNLEDPEVTLQTVENISSINDKINSAQYNFNTNSNSRYVSLSSVTYGEFEETTINSSYVYDFEENKIIELANSTNSMDLNTIQFLQDSNQLYVLEQTDSTYSVYLLNPEDSSRELITSFEIKNAYTYFSPYAISQNHLYATEEVQSESGTDSRFLVIDIESGKTVYSGKITTTDGQPLDQFSLNYFYVE